LNLPRLPLAAAVIALCSCGPSSDPPIIEATPITPGLGVPLNGTAVAESSGPLGTDECRGESSLVGGTPISPYGKCHNGPLLSGLLTSVALSPVTLADGEVLDGAAVLDGTAFTGTAGGVPVTDFTGATFTGTLASGGTVLLRIDGATAGTGDDADVWEYGVSYRTLPSGDWGPLCAAGATAVPVMGRWDYSQGTATGGDKIDDPTAFTFGCIGSAIAKCVYLGYKPWKTVSGVPLANHHQACTRAIRADYCGTGVSYTTAGRVIDLYDNIGIQTSTESWIPEGEWTPGGAKCTFALNRNIVAGLLCHPLRSLTCGGFTPGVLVLTKSPLDLLGGLLGADVGAATQPR
jgi:ADYC domain-containing protein